MHNYHSLAPSHEKRIDVGSLSNLNLTLILTAEQNICFSVSRQELYWKKVEFLRFQYYSCYHRNNKNIGVEKMSQRVIGVLHRQISELNLILNNFAHIPKISSKYLGKYFSSVQQI